MTEIWMIGDDVVYYGPRITLPNRYGHLWNYGFFDQKTGEVWGKRFGTEASCTWCYLPAEYPNLLLLFEDEWSMPDGLFHFRLLHKLEQLNEQSTRS